MELSPKHAWENAVGRCSTSGSQQPLLIASAIHLQPQLPPDAWRFERKHSFCKRENAYWVMDKKTKEGGYRLYSTERNDWKWNKLRKQDNLQIIHLNSPFTCCDPFDEWEDQLGFMLLFDPLHQEYLPTFLGKNESTGLPRHHWEPAPCHTLSGGKKAQVTLPTSMPNIAWVSG